MEIEGRQLKEGPVDSQNDHRIAMAGAIVGLILKEGVLLSGWKCVSKSHPNFVKDLKSSGITNGNDLIFRVAVNPPSSIKKEQLTILPVQPKCLQRRNPRWLQPLRVSSVLNCITLK